MKMILCAAGVTASLAACTHNEKKAQEPVSAQQTAQTKQEQQQQQRTQAARDAQQAISAFETNKKQYIQTAENDLNQLAANAARLKANALSTRAGRQDNQATIDALDQQLGQAHGRLDQVKEAGVQDWEQAQQEFEQSLLTARAAYDAAQARVAH